MANFKKLLAHSAALPLGLALFTTAGCTGMNFASSEFAPTHRWARPDTSIAEYNFHNVRCVRKSDVNTGGAEPDSPEFLAYRECMEEKGFELMGLTTRG
ncbi:MAG: hypothetical protein OXF31_01780 [Gammaproteobacteria bacterium]|nr:hypothetical protein [Gammaproteobacteria bacterium]